MKKIISTALATMMMFAFFNSLFAEDGKKNKAEIYKENIAAEMDKAAQNGLNTLLVITDKNGEKLDEALQLAEQTAALSSHVIVAVLDRNEPANEALIEKYRLSRYPAPFLLIIAPGGAVTGGASYGNITPEKLAVYLPSPGHNALLAAQSEQKATFIFINKQKTKKQKDWISTIAKVQSLMQPQPVIIEVNADDENEKTFLSKLGYQDQETPMLVVVSAAGQLTGKYTELPAHDVLKADASRIVKKGCGGCSSTKSCTDKKKTDCGSE